MNVLGVDTVGSAGGVCLRLGDRVLTGELGERGRHAEVLGPSVESLFAEAGCGWDALDLLAVNVGPGSFTGIRVGTAFVLGISEARGLPAVGVGCLDILARACYDATSIRTEFYIVSASDVKRGQVALARYRVGPDGPVVLEPEALVSTAEPGPPPPEGSVLAGDGAALLWADRGYRVWEGTGAERAAAAALLGEAARNRGDSEPPVPRYARPADARPRKA